MQDEAGNYNDTASSFEWSYDNVGPTVTVNAGDVHGTTVNTTPIDISFVFSESLVSFALSDISATNATVGNLDGSSTEYTATVTPTSLGTVSVEVSQDVQDAAGNENASASNTISFTFDSDDIITRIYSTDISNGDFS